MEVKFHDIGEGLTEGEIIHYFVSIGDEVEVDQPLLEVQTDKMVAEIPSPVAGKIEAIHFNTGETVTVGMTIMEIDDGTGSSTESSSSTVATLTKPATEKQVEHKGEVFTPQKRINHVKAAPYTRKVARENDVDIEKVTGTGKGGRVTETDVYNYINNKTATVESPEKHEDSQVTKEEEIVAETIPFKGIRKQIAKNLTYSVQTIPHVTHFEEVNLTNLLEYRKELKAMDEHISVVPFFLKALSIALYDYPVLNAELDEENEVIRLHKQINIGLATDTEAGLVVPVLNDVNQKSLRNIQQEMKELTEKAQQGKLSVAEMNNGTFTISNVGPLGGVGATPIINHPQTGIMAFHKTKKTPVIIENGEMEVQDIMTLSLSFDHRVLDGADAVRFTNRFVELIEEPKKLFLELT